MVKNQKQGKNSLDVLSKIGIFASFLLITVLSVYFYSPVKKSNATSDEGSAQINLNVGAVVSLTLSSNDIAMTAGVGEFVHKSVNAIVSTNSPFGYTLTIEDNDNNTNMTSTDVSDVVASSFSDTKTSSTMPDNNWGFSIDNTNYSAIPVGGNPAVIARTNTVMTAASETTTVDFGIKVGGSLTASTYADTILFTAHANGDNDDCNNIFCIDEMQEMTTAICSATTTPLASATEIDWDGSHAGDTNYIPRTTLTDTRDNNTYLVSKFADGACWMSQNLELELSSSRALTSADTDLNSKASWTPSHSTSTNINTFSIENSYGAYYSGYPNFAHRPISYRSSDGYMRDGTTFSSTPSTNDGKSEWEKVGIYYDLDAATAGSDVSIFESYASWDWENPSLQMAPDSICPKGWRLPYEGSGVGSVHGFTDQYSWGINPYNSLLAFTATGKISQGDSYGHGEVASRFSAGGYGYWWTNYITDDYYASGQYLYSGSDWISTTGYDGAYRHEGAQVRCVAR